MKTALLICNLGVSTSMLKERMEAAFAASGEDIRLIAHPRAVLEDMIGDIDIVLIAPQIIYLKDEIIEICDKAEKKYLLIPFQVYGNMDGKAAADLTIQALKS